MYARHVIVQSSSIAVQSDMLLFPRREVRNAVMMMRRRAADKDEDCKVQSIPRTTR